MLDVEWTVHHYAQLDLEEIYDTYLTLVNDMYHDALDAIEEAIEGGVGTLEDFDYYAWTEEAQAQVRDALKKRIGGEQLEMQLKL